MRPRGRLTRPPEKRYVEQKKRERKEDFQTRVDTLKAKFHKE